MIAKLLGSHCVSGIPGLLFISISAEYSKAQANAFWGVFVFIYFGFVFTAADRLDQIGLELCCAAEGDLEHPLLSAVLGLQMRPTTSSLCDDHDGP